MELIDAWEAASPEIIERMTATIPLGRMAEPRDLAKVAAWPLSDRASYVTGAIVPVDGAPAPEDRLRGLGLVAVEEFPEQGLELVAFGGVEAGEELVLDGVGVVLEFFEVVVAGGGRGDDVAAPVGGVGLPVDVAGGLQPVEDAVHVVAVEAEAAAEVGLA